MALSNVDKLFVIGLLYGNIICMDKGKLAELNYLREKYEKLNEEVRKSLTHKDIGEHKLSSKIDFFVREKSVYGFSEDFNKYIKELKGKEIKKKRFSINKTLYVVFKNK